MRTHRPGAALLGASMFVFAHAASAQYNAVAGRSAPRLSIPVAVRASDGTVTVQQQERSPTTDRYGNAAGAQYDLAIDGAFEGQTVAVLHFYTHESFDFSLPRAALREKGFSVYRWSHAAPPIGEFRQGLARASQLWIISDADRRLSEAHLQAIQEFFEAGHGVYIWGDNQPYYADANAVARRLFDTEMSGDLPGAQVVGLQRAPGGVGVVRDHLLTTGLEQLYEGITIATLRPSESLQPLLYGSAGNLVAAYHERNGRRAIVDGGFTRLYIHWDTAGTARYVKNAAAWLANAERFGAPGRPRSAAPATTAPGPTAASATPPEGITVRSFAGSSVLQGTPSGAAARNWGSVVAWALFAGGALTIATVMVRGNRARGGS